MKYIDVHFEEITIQDNETGRQVTQILNIADSGIKYHLGALIVGVSRGELKGNFTITTKEVSERDQDILLAMRDKKRKR